jgi:hypothetical protein
MLRAGEGRDALSSQRPLLDQFWTNNGTFLWFYLTAVIVAEQQFLKKLKSFTIVLLYDGVGDGFERRACSHCAPRVRDAVWLTFIDTNLLLTRREHLAASREMHSQLLGLDQEHTISSREA